MQKSLGVCPGRVRDRGGPEPSAGSLVLGDLTEDLAGLGEQSKGGSPTRERRDTSALMAYGGTPARSEEATGPPCRCRCHSPRAGPGDPNHPRQPAASGRCTGRARALCIWRSRLALSPRDMAASNILVPSSCLSREVPHTNPNQSGPEAVDDHPEGSLKQGSEATLFLKGSTGTRCRSSLTNIYLLSY